MSEMQHVFAGIPVADYAAAIAWYERLFGRPPDVVVHEEEAMWQAAGAGWVYVVRDATRAGRALLAYLVDDLDAHIAELANRGITAAPIETLSSQTRKTIVTDPDGNTITIGSTPKLESS